MPITPTYPGVYIEELPSTVHTIVGVSTSVTAFVGYTKRGPADRATEVFSYGDFERAFGSLDPDCPLTYAVQQFFLNGGSDAWIVRVAAGAGTASATLANLASGGSRAHAERELVGLVGQLATHHRRQRHDQPGQPVQPDRHRVRRVGRIAGAQRVGVVPQPDYEQVRADLRRRRDQRRLEASQRGAAGLARERFRRQRRRNEHGDTPVTGVTIASGSRIAISANGEAPVEISFGPATGAAAIKAAIAAALVTAGLSDVECTTSGSAIVLTDSSTTIDERSRSTCCRRRPTTSARRWASAWPMAGPRSTRWPSTTRARRGRSAPG